VLSWQRYLLAGDRVVPASPIAGGDGVNRDNVTVASQGESNAGADS
jgi:hypothetical protein